MADRYRGTMYVGVTAHLTVRAFQHRTGAGAGFCPQHVLTRLVWMKRVGTILDCIAYEKRLKRWRREWKSVLIERGNPNWSIYSTRSRDGWRSEEAGPRLKTGVTRNV